MDWWRAILARGQSTVEQGERDTGDTLPILNTQFPDGAVILFEGIDQEAGRVYNTGPISYSNTNPKTLKIKNNTVLTNPVGSNALNLSENAGSLTFAY